MTQPINEWTFTEGYQVHELPFDHCLHRFAVIQGGEEIHSIVPPDLEEQAEIIELLNKGYGVDLMEDGNGNTVRALAPGFIEEYRGIRITYGRAIGRDPLEAGDYWAYQDGRQLFDGIDFLPELRERIDDYLAGN
ncbi:hypothetical protein [Bhargavaea beijingensis]|uniref:Uncharacterized protein n=1 Tax=Bhargavaea beijingensis TaxID=426756 RepID=A0ABX9ZC83_9BACL|nr:hypothetical protein [Bhargavaea beijingensis]RSK30980.1 hypothetical protein EJA12_09695 [Bhargavaea beijingensis]